MVHSIMAAKPTPFILLTLTLMLGGCATGVLGLGQPTPTQALPIPVEEAITAEGRLAPVRSTVLGFLTSGELSEIAVTEGDTVREGEVLASLGGREALGAALGQAKLEQISAQQALDDLQASADLMRTQSARALVDAQTALLDVQKALDHLETDYAFQQELDDRSEVIDDAHEELDDAREKLDDQMDLDPDDDARKEAQEDYDAAEWALVEAIYARDAWLNQLDQARAAVDLAQARLDQAQRDADAHRDGVDPDELALAQARRNNSLAQVAAAQRALDVMKLTAPYNATVVDVNELEPGEAITPDIMVVILADYSRWTVETRDLTELDVVNVALGQKVTVTPDALPELALEGVVESIDRAFTERSGDVLYTVHIGLDQVDPQLRWGMTVTVTFE